MLLPYNSDFTNRSISGIILVQPSSADLGGGVLKPLFLSMSAHMAPRDRVFVADIADEAPAGTGAIEIDPNRPIPLEKILGLAVALKPDIAVVDWPWADGIFAPRKRSRTLSLLSKHFECPLAVVHEKSWSEFGAVLAAIDPDPADEAALHLSREVLRFSAALAARQGLPLDLVNVWQLPEVHLLRSRRVNEREEVVTQLVREKCQKSITHLNDFIDTYLPSGGYRNLIHRKGGTTHQLYAITIREEGSILVLGSRCREGLARLFLGDRAEKVIDSAKSPVVVVKSPATPRAIVEQRAA